MTQEHPITPPPELVQQWWDGTHGALYEFEAVTTQAARWGADQELEACCEWMADETPNNYINALRAARRTKSPSLKEQALLALSHLLEGAAYSMDTTEPADYIRRALEQLED